MDIICLWKKLVETLITWQTLIGSVVGALVAIWGALYVENKKQISIKKDAHKQFLQIVQRESVANINALVEAIETIEKFLASLQKVTELIKQRGAEQWSTDRANFAALSLAPLSFNVMSSSTQSGYLDSLITKTYQRSNELPVIIDDLRNQLNDTYRTNEAIVLSKINSADFQKEQYIKQLTNYEKQVRHALLEVNIPLLLKDLFKLRAGVFEIESKGIEEWKKKIETLQDGKSEELKREVVDNYLLSLEKDNLEKLNIEVNPEEDKFE